MSAEPWTPITMADVRLCAGEGKFTAAQMLDACNAVLRSRSVDKFMDATDELLVKLRAIKDDADGLRGDLRTLLERWDQAQVDALGGGEYSGGLRDGYNDCAEQLRDLLTGMHQPGGETSTEK